MLTLPVYLRSGTYYFHMRVVGVQFKRSLKTSDPHVARLRALALLRAVHMIKPKLSDFGFDSRELSKYELDLSRGIAKSEGPEDHARMLEALKMLQATPSATPSVSLSETQIVPAKSGLRLMQVLDKMTQLRVNLKPATVLSYKNTVKELTYFLKNPLIAEVGVGDVTRFQEHLKANNNSLRTIDNKMATLAALFNFAKKQGYYFEENPAKDRKLLSKKDKILSGYAIFKPDEIRQIFESEFLKVQKTKSPDYYWVLVLAVLTGARVGEIAALDVSQIEKVSANFFKISIKESKTLAGIREIPVPIEVWNAGFSKFLDGKNAAFKYKPRPGKGSGNAIGKMFSRHLESIKIENPKLVFHSLRKFSNDFFEKNGLKFEPRCQLFGHEIESVNVNSYTKKYEAEELFELTKPIQMKLMAIIGLS